MPTSRAGVNNLGTANPRVSANELEAVRDNTININKHIKISNSYNEVILSFKF